MQLQNHVRDLKHIQTRLVERNESYLVTKTMSSKLVINAKVYLDRLAVFYHQNVIDFTHRLTQSEYEITMEYCVYGSFESLCQTIGGIPEDTCKHIIYLIIKVLEAAYSKKIVTSNLKLSNALIDGSFNLKLSDFESQVTLSRKLMYVSTSKKSESEDDIARNYSKVLSNLMCRMLVGRDIDDVILKLNQYSTISEQARLTMQEWRRPRDLFFNFNSLYNRKWFETLNRDGEVAVQASLRCQLKELLRKKTVTVVKRHRYLLRHFFEQQSRNLQELCRNILHREFQTLRVNLYEYQMRKLESTSVMVKIDEQPEEQIPWAQIELPSGSSEGLDGTTLSRKLKRQLDYSNATDGLFSRYLDKQPPFNKERLPEQVAEALRILTTSPERIEVYITLGDSLPLTLSLKNPRERTNHHQDGRPNISLHMVPLSKSVEFDRLMVILKKSQI